MREMIKEGQKPPLKEIEGYFAKRLKAVESTGLPVSVTTDLFGNTVIRSRKHVEETLHGFVPSMLVLSQAGRDLLSHNAHLLQRLAIGDIHGEEVGGELEGRVYKVPLQTRNGSQDFAVKYSFPIEVDKFDPWVNDVHTLGVDQMRVMQYAAQVNPLDGVQFVPPILATHDITIEPFVKDAVPLTAIYRNSPSLPESFAKKLSAAFPDPTVNLISRPFIQTVEQTAAHLAIELGQWFRRVKEARAIPSVSPYLQHDSNTNHWLISLPKFFTAFEAYASGRDDVSEKIKDSFTLVEIVKGQK